MNNEITNIVENLPSVAVVFSIILCRVAAMMVAMPALASQVPSVVRAALVVAITILMFPVLSQYFESVGAENVFDPSRIILMFGSEIFVGALIGWLAQLMVLALPISAQILSTFVGLSNVLQPDPEMGAQATAVSRLASLVVPVVLFASNLYVLPLHALEGSYRLFPPGHFPMAGDAARSVSQMTGKSFLLAFQLAMPFALLGTLWPAMLGLLNRFSPNIQVYYLAMPAQLLGGVFLLALFAQQMLQIWSGTIKVWLSALPGSGFS